jgi:alpha-N-acetylglucosaminidase
MTNSTIPALLSPPRRPSWRRARFFFRLAAVAVLAGSQFAFVPGARATTTAESSSALRRTQELIARVLPDRRATFVCELIPADAGRDVFEYEAGPGGKVILRGNSGGSLAVALNQYLRHEARLDYDWLATGPLSRTAPLPPPAAKVRRACFAAERFFLNYCTYGYTTPWWDWPQWERFLDWMAMNGVNRPLLQAGQEAAWLAVWQSYGMTDEEVRAYFSGPAHLPWHRMANLDRWGGPLPQSYIEGQAQLQQRILARARELDMRPILSGFAGHVPPALARLRPGAKITPIAPGWSGMAPEYATAYLDPKDPLFAEIQGRFLREQTRLYGTDHLYAADPFNEINPPSWEPDYLAGVSASIYHGLTAADPDARWYQMTWTFTYEKLGRHWTRERLAAMLHAVPPGQMVLLDYAGEEREFYPQSENGYGLPFVWNYLGNFGGNTHLEAPLRKIAALAGRALATPNCIGVGSTLEALGVNPVAYALLLEQPWHDRAAPDLPAWIKDYADQRAGHADPAVEAAWTQLGDRVFVDNSRRQGTNGSIFQSLPPLKAWHGRKQNTATDYRPEDLVSALDRLFQAAPESRTADGYRYDVVNLTRQALCNLGLDISRAMQQALAQQDAAAFKREAARFLELGRDLDELLATRHEFLLGTWLTDARRWGRTPAEADYYEANAREILTAWHEPGGELTDYASRQWNGLLRTYYLPRWEKWIELAGQSLEQGAPFPEPEYIAWVNDACARWIHARGENYPVQPVGDPVATAERLFRKYHALLAGDRGAATVTRLPAVAPSSSH